MTLMPFLFQGPPGQDGISGPAGDRGPPVSDHTHKAQRCGDPTPHPSLVCRAPWEHLVPPVQGEKTEIRDPRGHQAYLVPLAPRELRQVDGPPSLSRGHTDFYPPVGRDWLHRPPGCSRGQGSSCMLVVMVTGVQLLQCMSLGTRDLLVQLGQ